MWFLIVNIHAKTETRVAFHFATEELNWSGAEKFGRLLLGDQFLCVEVDSSECPLAPVVKPTPAKPVTVLIAERRDGVIVYRDWLTAESVEAAIQNRFSGPLPDGFIIEKVMAS